MGRIYIIASGCAGAYGTADIIVEHEKELRSRYRSSFVDKMIRSCCAPAGAAAEQTAAQPVAMEVTRYAQAEPEKDALLWESGMQLMEHGYLGALYELAESRKCGIRIRLRAVPILQCSIEVCELYGLNPYRLPTYAGLILTLDPEAYLEGLAPEAKNMTACIGYLTDGRDKLIVDKTNIEYINRA